MAAVLVTGATGTVGRALVDELADEAVSVRAGTRDPEGAADRLPGGVEPTAFDFARPETWGPALKGIERVFLLYPPGTDSGTVREFADAAVRTGVDQVVFLSVLGAEKVPVLPHRRIERHLASAGAAHTFLRAAYFMQNLAEVHRYEIVHDDEIVIPAGTGRFGLIDARDVAAVAALALTEPGHRGRAYDLTGPASLDLYAVAAAFSEALGRPIRFADPSFLHFARRLYGRGVEPELIGFMLLEYGVARLGFAGRTTDTVERLLGRPPTDVSTFVSDYADRFEAVTAPA